MYKRQLLRILSGALEPTTGSVTMGAADRMSVLEQDHFNYDAYNVMDTVIMGNRRLYDIMKEQEALYAKEDFTDADGEKACLLYTSGAMICYDREFPESARVLMLKGAEPVSYTHLDVYKRQNPDAVGCDIRYCCHDPVFLKNKKGEIILLFAKFLDTEVNFTTSVSYTHLSRETCRALRWGASSSRPLRTAG